MREARTRRSVLVRVAAPAASMHARSVCSSRNSGRFRVSTDASESPGSRFPTDLEPSESCDLPAVGAKFVERLLGAFLELLPRREAQRVVLPSALDAPVGTVVILFSLLVLGLSICRLSDR
jgi:hypothetical protein